MAFTPVDASIVEKIITLHLAGQGRNAIDRQLKIEGARVSHGSISNIINRYKREHEQSLQPCNEVIVQGVGSKETGPSSLKSQDVGVGLGELTRISMDANIKKTDGSPSSVGDGLTVPISNSQIVNDSARDSDPEVNIAPLLNDVINQYVKEDEFIEEEEQEQQRGPERRFTLSDAKITSRSSYNRNRYQDQEQDQEQEQEEDWVARQPSVNVENNRSERRSRSGPKPIVDLDSDEITERGVIHFIDIDREQRRREIELINQGWQELENERHQNEQMKQSIDHRENNLKVREIKIADIEHLAPSLRQLQQMGADFFMMQSYILLVNERSVLGNIDTQQAAFLSHEFRELRSLGNILKERQKAEQRLSELNTLITQKQTTLNGIVGINYDNDVNNGHGDLSMNDWIRLNFLKGSTTNMLNKMTPR